MSAVVKESPEQERHRFLMELEFIQCLANPTYLTCKSKLLYLGRGQRDVGEIYVLVRVTNSI